MGRTILAFTLSAAIAAASCGGAQSQTQNHGDASIAPCGSIAASIWGRMVDDAPTDWLRDSSAYVFGENSAHFIGEDLRAAGNYIAYGCYPKGDGDFLVAKYSIIQHFNFKETYFEPEISCYSYNPKSSQISALDPGQFLAIDSTDFMAQNPFMCGWKNNLYFQFDSLGIVVQYIQESGVPPIRYSWNGETFQKVPAGVDYKDGIFSNCSPSDFCPDYFRDKYFSLEGSGNGSQDVIDPVLGKVASIFENSENKIEKVRIFSKMFRFSGIGIGSSISGESPEWLLGNLEEDSESKKVSAIVKEGDVVLEFLADCSTREIYEVSINLPGNRISSALFEVPANEPLDQIGRGIWGKVLDMKLFSPRSGVSFLSASRNSAAFFTEELSIVWDYVEYNFDYCLQMAYFPMSDAKFKVYVLETLMYDEYDQINLKYTPKERILAKAFIYDGQNLKESAFDLPDPTPGNLPGNSDVEYDPVGYYSFSENGATVCYNQHYEDGTDAEGGEVFSKSAGYVWTGSGWESAPEE